MVGFFLRISMFYSIFGYAIRRVDSIGDKRLGHRSRSPCIRSRARVGEARSAAKAAVIAAEGIMPRRRRSVATIVEVIRGTDRDFVIGDEPGLGA